jgi:uncharacterized protein DUF3891
MIVQSAAVDQPNFVITSISHADMAHQLSQRFGNRLFSSSQSARLINYIIRNHEVGWGILDSAPRWDPATGLPCHLSDVPEHLHIEKAKLSVVINESYHPLCGLLSSMHETGLYNRRYGLSEVQIISKSKLKNVAAVETFLEEQDRYQKRLNAEIAAVYPDMLAIPSALFNSYKLLEFFDTLALYFNRSHEQMWKKETFDHVPTGAENDAIVTIEHVGSWTVSLDPWPFNVETFTISCQGRYIYPCESEADFTKSFVSAPIENQEITLVHK